MSKIESLLRHRLVINKLRSKPCTFKEINSYLKDNDEFSEYILTCSLRTFQRDLKTIATLYNLEIEYNKSQRVYEIVYEVEDKQQVRLMESMEVFNALNITGNISKHLLLENRNPSGTQHLNELLNASKNKLEISFKYEKYSDDNINERFVNPLAIKEARHRWYLVAEDTKDNKIKTFGLDRISDINVSRINFDTPLNFDPEETFKDSFGIINGNDKLPQKIVLSFTRIEGSYVKSLPLHHSQKLILDNDKECRFQYYLLPTYDFTMEILSYGNQVEVLEPQKFRNEVAEKLKGALHRYEN